MKKMAAMMMALSMTACLVPSQIASAEEQEKTLMYSVIFTDGSSLEQKDIEAIIGTNVDYFEDITNTEFYEDSSARIFSTMDSMNEYETAVKQYCFAVSTWNMHTATNSLRKIQKQNPNILDARMIYQTPDERVFPAAPGVSIWMTPKPDVTDEKLAELKEEIAEDVILNTYVEAKKEWKSSIRPIIDEFEASSGEIDTMELLQAIADASLESLPDMTEYKERVSCYLANKYKEYFQVTQGSNFWQMMTEKDGIWKFFGDVNTDGEITANDAAGILIYCANAGSGVFDSETNPDVLLNGDTNADGVLDASDAANILAYSSAHGIGLDVDIRDYIQ